ncbi:hypothetical protein [Xanthobacter sp. KR7-225]|uniref:DUF6925 family protein n=1 Tax=Xanthobacter sp. KR7-225 TaxID=3156613 RepID=UPI0032B4AA81
MTDLLGDPNAVRGAGAFALLHHHAQDPRAGWSLGVFGGIAEFMRDAGEPARIAAAPERIEVATARGALRVIAHPGLVALPYEMPSRHAERRVPAIALCLPAAQAARAGRRAIAEIGPDLAAIREEDRGAVLFDLGIGLDAVEACVRTRDPVLIAALRKAEGRQMFDPDGPIGAILAASPHRVFVSALGRIEVFQPIPPADGRSPDGPHTHVLPRLLAHGRTHAASVPIPDGLVPGLSLHPPRAGTPGRA